jgi:hypothetical protein
MVLNLQVTTCLEAQALHVQRDNTSYLCSAALAASTCVPTCPAAIAVSQRPEASSWTPQQWADLVEAALTIVSSQLNLVAALRCTVLLPYDRYFLVEA